MNNNTTNTFYVERTNELLNALHNRNIKYLKKMCLPNIECFYNNCHLGIQTSQLIQILSDISHVTDKTKLIIKNCVMQQINSEVKIISVHYEINVFEYKNSRQMFYAQLVYNHTKVASVRINDIPILYQVYQISTSKDEAFFRDEREIMYLETMHNHIIWHCLNENITERTSFRFIEDKLSSNFIKIHRCYILNTLYLKHVQNYEVQMTNGDILPIPRKRYLEVKEKLEHCIKNRS